MLKHKTLGYSFVGIWKNVLTTVPVLDEKFCRALFGDPYTTVTGISPEGFFITRPSVPGSTASTVVISNIKLQVSSSNLDELVEVLKKLRIEILRVHSNLEFNFFQFGLNTEHEVAGLDSLGAEWISKNFINLPNNQYNYKIVAKDVNFELSDETKSLRYSIQIQPRFAISDAIYLLVNKHKSDNLILDEDTDVKKMFEIAMTEIKTQIFQTLKLAL